MNINRATAAGALAISLGLFAGSAFASPFFEEYDAVGIGFSDTNWDTEGNFGAFPTAGGSLILPLFDPMGGTRLLQSVTLTGFARARGQTTIENNGETTLIYGTPNDEVSGSVVMESLVGTITISLNPIATANIGSGTIVSGGSDVVIEVGGGSSGAGVSDDAALFWSGLDAQEFVGIGTFSLEAYALGVQTISLSGQGSVSVALQAGADASITYEWIESSTEVPEPATVALFGLGLLGLGALWRRRLFS